MLNSAIQRISIRETNVVFHRIEIYPVDSVIRLLNNWGLVKSLCETALNSLSNPNRISERAMIGLLKIHSRFANQVEGKFAMHFR